ncbi:hypothetical protein C5167_036254 [Papaver somniferum]|nr:hypothetical protein C5167_036254 [Papaver somniferum]
MTLTRFKLDLSIMVVYGSGWSSAHATFYCGVVVFLVPRPENPAELGGKTWLWLS